MAPLAPFVFVLGVIGRVAHLFGASVEENDWLAARLGGAPGVLVLPFGSRKIAGSIRLLVIRRQRGSHAGPEEDDNDVAFRRSGQTLIDGLLGRERRDHRRTAAFGPCDRPDRDAISNPRLVAQALEHLERLHALVAHVARRREEDTNFADRAVSARHAGAERSKPLGRPIMDGAALPGLAVA